LAPRPARPPPHRPLPAPPQRSTPHAAFDPRPGTAVGPGEQQLGLPARARRTAGPRDQRRRVHRGRSSTRQVSTPHRTAPQPPGLTSCARRPTPCRPRPSSKRPL
jgi:hypothetical protein